MRELLAGETAINRQQGCAVARIMLHARDVALSQSLQDAAARAGPGQTVAGVVGDAHMQGVCEHWHQSLHADQAGPGAVWQSGSRGSADGHKAEMEKRQGGSRAEAEGMGPSEDAGLMGMRVALAESVLSLQVRLVHLHFACTCLPSLSAWLGLLLAYIHSRLIVPVRAAQFMSFYPCSTPELLFRLLKTGWARLTCKPYCKPCLTGCLFADAGGQHDAAVFLRGHCSKVEPGPDRSVRAGAGAVCQPAHASRCAGPSASIAGAARAQVILLIC